MKNLRFIPTKVHGVLDYITGSALMNTPFLPFSRGKIETVIPVGLGAGAALYSMFTNYELGAVRKIPMKTHLAVDIASGALLAASPFIFGFYKRVWVPHVAVGLFEIAAGLFTKTRPGEDQFVLQPA